MVVVSFDGCSRSLKADVVEAFERSAVDVFDFVVRNQKLFLPAHKTELRIFEYRVIEGVRIEMFRVLMK